MAAFKVSSKEAERQFLVDGRPAVFGGQIGRLMPIEWPLPGNPNEEANGEKWRTPDKCCFRAEVWPVKAP